MLADYPAEVRLEVYEAVIRYAASGTLTELRPLAKMAFSFIKKDIDCQPKQQSREQHWNWKGGITDENHRIRESSSYKHWRKAVFEKGNYTCQICGQHGGCLNAHHIKPFSIYPELRFEVSNGITLCRQCHINIHKTEREWDKHKRK